MSFVKYRSTSETSKIARKRRKTTGKASEGRLTLVLSSSKKIMVTRQVQRSLQIKMQKIPGFLRFREV